MPLGVHADEDMPVAQLPQVVRDAIEKRFTGAELISAERDQDKHGVEYEVEIRHQGQRYEADVREDGRIDHIDREDRNPR